MYDCSKIIGNGLRLKITHIETAMIKSENEARYLKIKKYLMSIQSLSKNLNCKFILNRKNFKVKDNKT